MNQTVLLEQQEIQKVRPTYDQFVFEMEKILRSTRRKELLFRRTILRLLRYGEVLKGAGFCDFHILQSVKHVVPIYDAKFSGEREALGLTKVVLDYYTPVPKLNLELEASLIEASEIYLKNDIRTLEVARASGELPAMLVSVSE
jgi:hypothetical protein